MTNQVLFASLENKVLRTALLEPYIYNINDTRSLIAEVTDQEKDDASLVKIGDRHFKVGHQAGLKTNCLNVAKLDKNSPKTLLPLLLANTPTNFNGNIRLYLENRDKQTEASLRTAIVGQHTISVSGERRTVRYQDIEFIGKEKALLASCLASWFALVKVGLLLLLI